MDKVLVEVPCVLDIQHCGLDSPVIGQCDISKTVHLFEFPHTVDSRKAGGVIPSEENNIVHD